MKQLKLFFGELVFIAAITGCNNKEEAKTPARPTLPGGTAATSTAPKLKIGYVLHSLNDFTQVIKNGAEDAGKYLGDDVDVTGPPGFVVQEPIAMIEGMGQLKNEGMALVLHPLCG